MNILALNFGHDAAVAVLRDHEVVNCLLRERHTRVKHHIGLTVDLIDKALADAGLRVQDIDYCAIVSSQRIEFILPVDDPLEIRAELHARHPESADSACRDQYRDRAAAAAEVVMPMREHLGRSGSDPGFLAEIFPEGAPYDPAAWRHIPSPDIYANPPEWKQHLTLKEIAAQRVELAQIADRRRQFDLPVTVRLHGREIPGYCVQHHMAHAASNYYQSGFPEAAILSNDGGVASDYLSGFMLYARDTAIYPLFPHYNNVGALYILMSQHLHLGEWDASGKLMGLASYGEPAFFKPEFVGNRFEKGEDYSNGNKEWISHYRQLAAELGYDMSVAGLRDFATAPINADVAASCEQLLEQTLLYTARSLRRLLDNSGLATRNLGHTGGTALSCPTNSLLAGAGLFDRVFVEPGCNDSGLAIGAGLYVNHQILDRPLRPRGPGYWPSAYLGPQVAPGAVTAALAAADGAVVELQVADAAEDAAAALARNEIIGWFEGRSEIGPRALGHRSILADPRDGSNLLRVNEVKGRETWRPFAPAVLEEEAAQWFAGTPLPSPFMLFTADVLQPHRVPAITHVDGTARVQTVNAGCGGYYRLIKAFHRLTGVPVVINTSFNGPGQPVIETPAEAVDFLLNAGLDRLYVDGRVLVRATAETATAEPAGRRQEELADA
ncbi:MAG: carbamoyltransferase C-terminal domain-containing protein [Sneathiellaceae bacterium]